MSASIVSEMRTCSTCKETHPLNREHFSISTLSWRDKTRTYFTKDCRKCRSKKSSIRLKNCQYCGVSLKELKKKIWCSPRCRLLEELGGPGATYGRLTILDYEGLDEERKRSVILCKCECGNETIVAYSNLIAGKTQSCGCLYKDWHEDQKKANDGKRKKIKLGYVLILKHGHPNEYRKGWVFEHVYVMSQFLGRPIRKGEEIHHRNGERSDNVITNLELWTKHHPPGQRVEDMVAFCDAYLKQYKADARKLAQIHEPADPRQPVLFD